jgi:hypothetical protein
MAATRCLQYDFLNRGFVMSGISPLLVLSRAKFDLYNTVSQRYLKSSHEQLANIGISPKANLIQLSSLIGVSGEDLN